jgi:4-hydroxybenzoate polyprenyltransferase
MIITTKLTGGMLLLLLFMSLLTLFYCFPFNSVNKNLRKTPGLKIFIVATVWSLLIVVFQIINFTNKLDVSFLIFFVQVLIFVIVTIFPFEIRDLNSDCKQLRTIPQIIGVKNTKVLGFCLLLIFMILDYIQYLILNFISFKSILINAGICLTTFTLILKSKENQSIYFSSFWVESLPILWLLLYIIL